MSHLFQRKALQPLAAALLGGVMACGAAAPALAQAAGGYQQAVPPTSPGELSGDRGIDRRLDRDEKTLRDLRDIVLQAKASGKPVEIRDAGPDPLVGDMQAKLDDLDQTLRRLTGELETQGHDLDVARKAATDANEASKVLAARIDKLEAALQAQAQPGPPPAPSAAGPAPTGVLGQLPASAAAAPDQGTEPGPADEILAYRQARQVLDTGDYAGGAAALQDYLARYPTSPRAPEANYWLGRTLALRNIQTDAASAYARSLKGWPQTPWAGDAVVRLSGALIELKRADDACKALTEFDARYAAKATAAVKTRAKDTRARAACS